MIPNNPFKTMNPLLDEIDALVAELELDAGHDFDDIIAALREYVEIAEELNGTAGL